MILLSRGNTISGRGHPVPNSRKIEHNFRNMRAGNYLFFLIISPVVSLRHGFNSPRLHQLSQGCSSKLNPAQPRRNAA